MSIERLDAVSTFNEKLSFLIPHEWVEVDSGADGSYQYQMPDATSGFFRVSLVTADGSAEQLRERFEKEFGNIEVNTATGNFIARSEKALTQDGTPIHIHYWFVGGSVALNVVREAVFSYTILADFANESETQSNVEIIGKLVADARFDRASDDMYREIAYC